jgi:hypothetical protein
MTTGKFNLDLISSCAADSQRPAREAIIATCHAWGEYFGT